MRALVLVIRERTLRHTPTDDLGELDVAALGEQSEQQVGDAPVEHVILIIAGAPLRNAGAKSVAPLVLHQLASADPTEG